MPPIWISSSIPTGGRPVQSRTASGNLSWSKKHLQSFLDRSNFFPCATSMRGNEQGVASIGGGGGGTQTSDTRLPSQTSLTFLDPFLATPKTVPPALTSRRSSTLPVRSCLTTKRMYSGRSSPLMLANLSKPGMGEGNNFVSSVTMLRCSEDMYLRGHTRPALGSRSQSSATSLDEGLAPSSAILPMIFSKASGP